MSIVHPLGQRYRTLPALLLSACVGCSMFETRVQPEPPPPAQPAPEAAAPQVQGEYVSNAGIRLFGQLTTGSPTPFAAPSATSLRRQTMNEEGADADPCLDPTGGYVVFSSTRHSRTPQIYMQATDGVSVMQITSGRQSDIQPAFSPDGRFVAFASDRTGNWDIWVIDLEDRSLRQITRSEANELHPSWAPDGSRMVYSKRNPNSQRWELWISPVTGPALEGSFIGYGYAPTWSPVGDRILYQRARERGGRWFSVWYVDLINGEPALPVEIAASARHAYIQPAWSPDGKYVAFCQVQPSSMAPQGDMMEPTPSVETATIWMVDEDGRGAVQLTDGEGHDFGPAWGPDGRVYFSSTREGVESIWSLKPAPPPAGNAGSDPMTAQADQPAPNAG